jgi:hypothetical protein
MLQVHELTPDISLQGNERNSSLDGTPVSEH